MENNKANTILLVVISIATLLTAVVGATFAFFTARLTGVENTDSVIIKAGTLGTVFEGGEAITVQNIYPRNDHVYATKEFTITGSTDTEGVKIHYSIFLAVDSNSFKDGSLQYTLRRTEDSNGQMMPVVTNPVGISNVAGNSKIGDGYFEGPVENGSHTYFVEIRYPDTGADQNDEQEAEFKGHIEIEVLDSSQGGN